MPDQQDDAADFTTFQARQVLAVQHFAVILDELTNRAAKMTAADGQPYEQALDNPRAWPTRELILFLAMAEPEPQAVID